MEECGKRFPRTVGSCVVAGYACHLSLAGVETIGKKTHRSVFSLGNGNLTARSFFYLDGDRLYSGLARIFAGTCLAVVEHPPLSVYFNDATVGITIGVCGISGITIMVYATCTAVDYGTAISERAERAIAVGVS